MASPKPPANSAISALFCCPYTTPGKIPRFVIPITSVARVGGQHALPLHFGSSGSATNAHVGLGENCGPFRSGLRLLVGRARRGAAGQDRRRRSREESGVRQFTAPVGRRERFRQ